MKILQWRAKNVFKCILFVILGLVGVKTIYLVWATYVIHLFSPDDQLTCNSALNWRESPANQPQDSATVALLGPVGSGVEWLRYLIEQVSGMYTGSNLHKNHHLFKAEGLTQNVVVVMAHEWNSSIPVVSAIIVWRNLKDTLRTLYSVQQTDNIFEPSVIKYQGSEWAQFVIWQTKQWQQSYRQYNELKRPTLVIDYEDLNNPARMKLTLLKIISFLHVPVKTSVLECVTERGNEFELKPKSLRFGFDPFAFLSMDEQKQVDIANDAVAQLINDLRARFHPKMHVLKQMVTSINLGN